jgi:hypothetical protein
VFRRAGHAFSSAEGSGRLAGLTTFILILGYINPIRPTHSVRLGFLVLAFKASSFTAAQKIPCQKTWPYCVVGVAGLLVVILLRGKTVK